MTTEDDFHAILDSNPDDWQTRLVFADWLDEQNDPRASGIRALGLYQRKAMACQIQGGPLRFILGTIDIAPKIHRDNWAGCLLHVDWFVATPLSTNCDHTHDKWRYYVTRREGEDAAAIGFTMLPEARREELLTGLDALFPVKIAKGKSTKSAKKAPTPPKAKRTAQPKAKSKADTPPKTKAKPKGKPKA